jgi:Skp family chaperone for outer membrane proteins
MRMLATLSLLLFTATASAADVKICVIDAEAAITNTKEGKAALQGLQTAAAAKEAELTKMQEQYQLELQDYEQRKLILSQDARAQEEAGLMDKGRQLEAFYGQAQMEMQQASMDVLGGLQEKLLQVASTLGARKGCTVLLQQAAAIYVDSSVENLTQTLVTDYDAAN